MFLIHWWQAAVDGHRNVYVRRSHLITNWVSSCAGPMNTMELYGIRFALPEGVRSSASCKGMGAQVGA
jgi:hypothetical protein